MRGYKNVEVYKSPERRCNPYFYDINDVSFCNACCGCFFVILLSSETHHINDICQLAIEKTAYILATQGGDTSSDNENVLGDNLIVEERLREELSNLLSSHNMSLTAADISFNGKEVTITGTVNVQTKSPFGTSSEKTINFKYKGRFNKNYGM